MQNIRIICVGKLRESYLREAFAEYEKRLRPYCRFELIELTEERLPNEPSETLIRRALQAEGERILKAAEGSEIFALCIEGKEFTSTQFAQRIGKAAVEGEQSLSFVIGSSFGLSDEVKNSAREKISFSRMTFPHQLFRVMLAEQIYRAFSILGGGKYHK